MPNKDNKKGCECSPVYFYPIFLFVYALGQLHQILLHHLVNYAVLD